MSESLRRKHIRLSGEVHATENNICSATIAVAKRQSVFAGPALAAEAVRILRAHATARSIAVHAYCVMPDHVHLILAAGPTCDIVTFVGEYKNLVVRASWKFGYEGSFWQKSFWDHFLRDEESLEKAVNYVLDNPVRAGLVARRSEYPYSGSMTMDLSLAES